MADVTDSKSVGSNTVRVQVPLPAPNRKAPIRVLFYLAPSMDNAEYALSVPYSRIR